jgi:NADH dehydrogenase
VSAPERVLVAGATGYLGRRLIPRLLASGRIVRALVRGGAARAARLPHLAGCEIAAGDLADAASCRRAAEGVDTVIHLVGIIRETGGATFESVHVGGTVALVQAARHAGARRFLYVSAIGARDEAPTAYWRTKAEAERIVASSGLTWLVLRPSLVLAKDGEFYGILKQLTAVPIVPVLGPGTTRIQAVHAEDLAEVEARALDHPESWNRIVDVVGPEAIPFKTLLARTAKGLRRPVFFVHVPIALARPFIHLAAALLPAPPITPGQLAMLAEDSVGDAGEVERRFGVCVRPIDDVLGDRPAGAA